MKTKYYFLTLMLALFAGTSLTSCDIWDDEDYDQAKALSGQWQGDFGMNYNYTYGGRTYTFDSYDTDVVFYPDYNGARKGWGKQVDFYEYGPYEYIYHKFDWRIVDGIVQLRYPDDPRMNTDIYDYHMTNDRFTGYFDDSNDQFCLIKIRDYYDWTPYVNSYGYRDRNNWYSSYGRYYAKKRNNAETDTLSAITPDTAGEGQIVGFGNRFKKN